MGELAEIGSLAGELSASALQALFEERQGLEALVGDTLPQRRPEPLGRLEFRAVGGQIMEVKAFGNLQLFAGVPAGSIDQQHNLLLRACAGEKSKLL